MCTYILQFTAVMDQDHKNAEIIGHVGRIVTERPRMKNRGQNRLNLSG